jgi:hypothetical protein
MARTLRWVVLLLGIVAVVAIVARQLGKSDRQTPRVPNGSSDRDRLVDEEIDESFPASDAPSHWAGGAD